VSPSVTNAAKPAPKRSVLHRVVFGTALVVAGLLLAASILVPIIYIIAVLRFFSGFGG